MKIICLGFSLFLMQIFPMGWVRSLVPIGDLLSGLPKYITYTADLVLVLLLLTAVTFFFLKKINQRYSLPDEAPGRKWMLVGIACYGLYLLLFALATSVSGGGSTFLFLQVAAYLLVPCKICLLVGSVKILLSYQVAK